MLKRALNEFTQGDHDTALGTIKEHLEDCGDDFKALLLHAKILQVKKEFQKANESLEKASKITPGEPVAWKGLIRGYLQTKEYGKLLDALESLILALESQGENGRQEATDEFSTVSRTVSLNGSPEDKERLLLMQLPGSKIYDFMRGRMLPPSQALGRLIKTKQKNLRDALSRIQGRARMNISKTPAKIAAEKLAEYNNSTLPSLLEQQINISDDDIERREAEASLFEVRYSQLELTPTRGKAPLRDEVRELVDGMVLFKPHTPDAFIVYWDWSDIVDYKQLDRSLLSKFIELFPKHGLSKIITAFLNSSLSPFQATYGNRADDDGDSASQEGAEEDMLLTHQEIGSLFSEGFEEANAVILAVRIVADFYLQSTEYTRAAQLSQEGIRLVENTKKRFAVSLPHTTKHLSLVLATSYIYYQAPKNFPAATAMFDEILKQDKDNSEATIGKGLLLLQQNKLAEAENLLQKAANSQPDNVDVLSQLAWCKIRQGNLENGRKCLEKCLELAKGFTQQDIDRKATLYWRLGYCYYQEKDYRHAYDLFHDALKVNPSFAPAFTYLGIFYRHVGDYNRATRAFHKALELDNGQVIAGKYLAADFAAQSQWDLVEIIAAKVLESDKVGQIDTETGESIVWPYRAMGIVSLNRGDYAKAVSYFQRCLRLAPGDANSWVGLGEAYGHTGRFMSAYKALNHAITLEPENLSALYELSVAQRETLQFSEAAKTLELALVISPHNPSLVSALVDTHIRAAQSELQNSYLGDAVDSAVEAIKCCKEDLTRERSHSSVWTSFSDACEVFLQAQKQKNKVPIEDIGAIRSLMEPSSALSLPTADGGEDEYRSFLVDSMLCGCNAALQFVKDVKSARAVAHFNVALANLKAFLVYKSPNASLSVSIEHLKCAITLEPRNEVYWNLYGVALHDMNPAVAQHCFIRCLGLDSRCASAWTNLGLLYVEHGDIELGSDALDRGLTLEPESSHGWLGQAMIARDEQKLTKFRHLVQQAYDTAPGQDRISKFLLGFSTYEQNYDGDCSRVGYGGITALEKLLDMDPWAPEAIELMSDLLERSGDFEEAAVRLLNLSSSKKQKADVHSQLARVYLGARNWEKAIEHAMSALAVDVEEPRVHLSSILTSGLANYFCGNFDTALEMFTSALEYSDADKDVTILLAKVLWAQGGEEERSTALEQLYSTISDDGASIETTELLGTMGLASDDVSLKEAVLDELETPTLEQMQRDKQGLIPSIVSKIKGSPEPYYRALMYFPTRYNLWKHVNSEQALILAMVRANSCKELSNAYVAVGGVENQKRAVFYCPNNRNAWQGLARCAADEAGDIQGCKQATSKLTLSEVN